MTKEGKERLKYFDYMHSCNAEAALHAAITFFKDKSGPLKPVVESVEGAVKTVVGPVYEKYHDLPLEVLKYADQKLDTSVTELSHRAPPVLKQLFAQTISTVLSAHTAVRAVTSELLSVGIVETASGIVKSAYTKYEPKAEQCAVSAWKKLNQLPLFPRLAQVVVPAAAFFSEKYNESVVKAAEKGYRVSSYMPLVPTERISKIFAEKKV